MKEGWVCPRCKKVNAPFIASCDCKENIKSNADCNHKWKFCGAKTDGNTYKCENCGKIKKEFYMPSLELVTLESTEEFCL